ncbi:MAG TPA: thiamine pyrophosphate-binding protein [Chloroflexota bacterium]
MKMKVAEVLVRYLRQQGVEHVFGVTGHSVFDITDAIYQEPGIDFLPSQIEVSAGYMANGYARGTRGLSISLVSSGAGATNAISGAAQAFKESYPVLIISSDIDTAFSGKGASSWHEVPQQEMFQPITKLSVTLRKAEDTLEVLQDAVRAASTGRYGPVYLGVPRDVQVEEIEVPDGSWRDDPPAAHAPDRHHIQQAADLLAHAAAPTIIAGGGVHWARCEPEIIELAELLHAPIGVTPSQKGLISEEHPLALGVLGSGSAPFANAYCQDADVILAVGATFSEPLTLGYGHRVIPEGAKVIHIDIDSGEIGKSYPAEVGIAGDAKPALHALINRLKAADHGAPPSDRIARMQKEKAAWRANQAKEGQAADGPINQWQLYGALREAIDEDAIVVAEGGTQELVHRFVATAPVYHGGEFRAIGHGLGTALGAKCAFPDRQVVCMSGDGSFMMELQELSTAVRAQLPIVCVVVHNDAYGNMKRDQVHSYGGRVIGTELHIPDLVKLADAFGVYGARVERSADLAPAIRTALAANRPALIDAVCPIEPRA